MCAKPYRVTTGCFRLVRSRGVARVVAAIARGGQVQVYSRYLEFPDGTFFPLPARPVPAQLKPKAPISRRQSARRRRDRKS